MKLALVHPPEVRPSIGSQIIQHPINMLQLAAYLQSSGVEVVVWDFNAAPYSENDYIKRLMEYEPDAIGFSCVTPKVKTGARLAGIAQKWNGDVLTLIGGPHVSSIPEHTLQEFPSFDIGIIGEGEITSAEVLKRLKQGDSLSGIPGTVFREDGEIKLAKPRELISDLDRLPFPARELIHFSDYTGSSSPGISNQAQTISQLFTSRGCPVQCIFCGSHVTHGNKVRFRSSEHVMGEVVHCIEKYGVNHFTIDDDTFTYGKKRLLRICDRFAELPATWDCDSRVDTIDEATLKIMARSGCVKIAFGVESGSPRMLELIRKKITRQQIENAFTWAGKAGIMTSGFLMIGSHPSETVEDLDETLRFMKKLRPDYLMVYCAVPYPGTELYRMMKKSGLIISEDWDEYDIVRTRPVWRTENFEPDDLVRLQQSLYRKFYLRPGYIVKKLLDLRSLDDVKYILKSGAALLGYIFSKDRTRDHST